MDTPFASLVGVASLSEAADFRLGAIRVSPSRRILEGPVGLRHLQPQVMLVFMCLASRREEVVTRRSLFESCWGGTLVGDDSLNRTLTAVRQALKAVGADAITIETVPRTGYRLVASDHSAPRQAARDKAIESAVDCWRMGLPQSDVAELMALEAVLDEEECDPGAWGTLALLLRKAVENAVAPECADLVRRCERAARKALSLDSEEASARVALTGLMPLFGNWGSVRNDLEDVAATTPNHPAALHDLAVLEMASGRPSSAAPIIDRLIQGDRLAATYHYKRMYHLWTLGDLQAAEQVAAHAMALWPQHPAVWMARFWTLLFTDRPQHALRMTRDDQCQAFLAAPLLPFLRRTAELNLACKNGRERDREVRAHIVNAVEVAAVGPALAVASLMTLCAFDAIDEIFEVGFGYYLGRGDAVAPLRSNAGDPSITDQHRRVTQPLFIPSARNMRRDPRFLLLCEEIGLTAYWEQFGIVPDFLATAD